jgi:glycerophosphoryl diester phosphodiesterase
VLLLAHRGASADAPENTLEAFEEAVAQGADGVELDVRRCASGEIVVCHDSALTRLAGVPESVEMSPWSFLQTLDVGSSLGFKKAQIPLLSEVVEALPSHFLLNVELKSESVDDRGLSRAVAHYVRSTRLEDRVVISSFNPLSVVRVGRAAPELRRGYLIDPDKPYWIHGGLFTPLVSTFSVHPSAQACTPERVQRWRSRGLKIAVWTVDDPAEARRLKTLGVDYLITNQPGALKKAL